VKRRAREVVSNGVNHVGKARLNVTDLSGSDVGDVRNGVAVDAASVAVGAAGVTMGAAGRDADVEVLVNTNSLTNVHRADLRVDGDVRVKVNGNEVVVVGVRTRSALVEIAVDDLDRCKSSVGDFGDYAERVHVVLLLLVVIAGDVVVRRVADDSA
jgi:hypothetical protein